MLDPETIHRPYLLRPIISSANEDPELLRASTPPEAPPSFKKKSLARVQLRTHPRSGAAKPFWTSRRLHRRKLEV